MRNLERYENQVEAIKAALDGKQKEIWTALPAIIQSYDATKMTCTAQVTVMVPIIQRNGTYKEVQLPILLDVPVMFQGGGGFTLTFPVVKGDEALIVFSARCIDAWWYYGTVAPAPEIRFHDLSDGFAFVGVRSRPRVLTGVSTTSTQLRSDDGTTYLELLQGLINIVAPTQLNVNSTTQVNVNSPWINLSSWVGMIVPFGMDTPPAGWLACPTAQTLVSTTTYAALFAAIGYTWGGAGASFGLPFFPQGYVPYAGTAGVLSHGKIKDHLHVITYGTYGGSMGYYPGSGVAYGWGAANSQNPVAPEGGPDNLAAGYGVKYCVKY